MDSYNKKLEDDFLDFVYDKISNKDIPIKWCLVGSFKHYLYNIHPNYLNEFHYRISDNEEPRKVMYDISNKIESDETLDYILYEIEKIK